MQGQVTRSGQMTSLCKQIYNRATTTVFEGKLRNFRNMVSSSLPTKLTSQIYYICDLRSGHFGDLPILSQWAKNKLWH